MFEVAVTIAICLVILGAWFMLGVEAAEVILSAFLLLAAGLGIYWLWTRGHASGIVEGVGLFVLLVIVLGAMRLGIEKLRDSLMTPFPLPYDATAKGRGKASQGWRRRVLPKNGYKQQ